MGLLLNYNDNITWLNTWIFVSFSVENICLVIWCTFVDFSFYYFLFFGNLFAIAALTFVLFINHFALTTTIVTRSTWLSIHTWSKHLHFCNHTSAFASATLLYSAIFASFAFAFTTDSLAIHSYFSLFTSVNFLEGNLKRMLNWLHFFWLLRLTAAHSTAKHLTENIIHTAMATSAFFETIFSELIIKISLFFIC